MLNSLNFTQIYRFMTHSFLHIKDKPYFSQLMYLLFLVLICYTFFSLMQMLALLLMGYDVKGIEQMLDNIDAENMPMLKVMQLISTIGVFIIPALMFSYLQTGKAVGYVSVKLPLSIRAVWLTILVTICALPLMSFFMELNQSLRLPSFLGSVEEWMRQTETKAEKLTYLFLAMHSPLDLAINITVIALFPAVAEELMFRGCLQKLLVTWTQKPHLAIFLSAALFSAFHLQFFGFIPRMLIGAFLGYLFYWSGNLWYAIIGHFINNALQVVAYYFTQNSASASPDMKLTESLPLSSVLIGTVLFAGSLYLFNRQFQPTPLLMATTSYNNEPEAEQ